MHTGEYHGRPPERKPFPIFELCFVAVVGLFLFWLFCLNHISVQEVGIEYNSWDGSIRVQRSPGWHVTSPTTQVAAVGTLPTQVCIFAGTRITNCKMVRFVATDEAVKAFISQQGFHYYGSTRGGSCNTAASDTCGGVPGILKGYAFSGEAQPFLEVLREENPIGK